MSLHIVPLQQDLGLAMTHIQQQVQAPHLAKMSAWYVGITVHVHGEELLV